VATTYIATRDVPLTDLTRYPGNARRGDVDAIRASIRRHGQYRSLVVRDTGDQLVILAGNHTRDALEAEGRTTARCEIIHCDDDEARRINLADNRLAELGGYDDAALTELLSSLNGDLEGTGWQDEDLQTLLAPPQQLPEEGDAPIDETDALWGVIAMCSTEQQQTELLGRLAAEGLTVRALLT
jgi:ParB-like chromosome segregation protein Spo0J